MKTTSRSEGLLRLRGRAAALLHGLLPAKVRRRDFDKWWETYPFKETRPTPAKRAWLKTNALGETPSAILIDEDEERSDP